MLEYTKAGGGARLAMLVLHDDAKREYAYGPARGLPDTKVGTFTQALYDEGKKNGWTVISMKNDWKAIFSLRTNECAASMGDFNLYLCPKSYSYPDHLLVRILHWHQELVAISRPEVWRC